MAIGSTDRAQWEGDVLQRKPIADFLHRLLLEKYGASRDVLGPGAICFALDGAWGSGKTFFVDNWVHDVEAFGHPVMFFDAWKNDLSKEPLMGFLAAFRESIGEWAKQVPAEKKVKAQTTKVTRNMLRQAGRAVLPISALIAKGLLKKVSGIELQEWLDVIRVDEGAQSTEETASSADATQLKNQVIDEFFNASLEEHARHQKAVNDLKIAVGELLAYLQSHLKATLPMFVFVDELDRCRPNYAIELLEGMKHLFDVRGLCFCVSTNIAQLSESIKGVYGGGFDSRKYLKRFFEFEYALPVPSDHAFAQLLVPESLFSKRKKIVDGLSESSPAQSPAERISKTFHFVARGFRLDLRSQRQVFAIAEAASVGVPEDKPLHILFLFALAAARHLEPELFDALQSAENDKQTNGRISALIDHSWRHSYQVRVRGESAFRAEVETKQITLEQILNIYLRLSRKDLKATRDDSNKASSYDYPYPIEQTIAAEMPNTFYPQNDYPPSIRAYAVLIRTAGQLTATE